MVPSFASMKMIKFIEIPIDDDEREVKTQANGGVINSGSRVPGVGGGGISTKTGEFKERLKNGENLTIYYLRLLPW